MSEKLQAIQYYQTLAVKLQEYNLMSTDDIITQGTPWGLRATFFHKPSGNTYQSVWVYTPFRGRGFMSNYIVGNKVPFLTQLSCEIYEWFEARRVPYLMIPNSE